MTRRRTSRTTPATAAVRAAGANPDPTPTPDERTPDMARTTPAHPHARRGIPATPPTPRLSAAERAHAVFVRDVLAPDLAASGSEYTSADMVELVAIIDRVTRGGVSA